MNELTTQPIIFRLYQTIAKKSCIRSVYRPDSDMINYHFLIRSVYRSDTGFFGNCLIQSEYY